MIKITNDTSTLNGSLLEMKDQLISELANQGVTASYDPTTGLLGLIHKISEIPHDSWTTIYEDDCTTDNTSNYTFIPTRANATSTLTFNNQTYEIKLTKDSSEGIWVIPLTNITANDTLKIEYDVYKTNTVFGTMGGIYIYNDDNNWTTQKTNDGQNSDWYWGKKRNGAFTENSYNCFFAKRNVWYHITIIVDNDYLTLSMQDSDNHKFTTKLDVQQRTSNTQYGIPICWSNNCSFQIKNIKVEKKNE